MKYTACSGKEEERNGKRLHRKWSEDSKQTLEDKVGERRKEDRNNGRGISPPPHRQFRDLPEWAICGGWKGTGKKKTKIRKK